MKIDHIFSSIKNILGFLVVLIYILGNPLAATAGLDEEIAKKQQQIAELERQINEFKKEIEHRQGVAVSLQQEINRLNAQISRAKLEIRSLSIAIEASKLQIQRTDVEINETVNSINTLKSSLTQFIRLTNETDQVSLLEIILRHQELSDFFNQLEDVRSIQQQTQINIETLRILQAQLEEKRTTLEDQRTELMQLRDFQHSQQLELTSIQNQKDTILRQTRGEQQQYEKLVNTSQQDIQRIRTEIQFLLQQGISLEDAVKFGQLAAIRTNIRPEFLLAILEIESRLGQNVGSGNWQTDMYECYLKLGRPERAKTEKNAFLQITAELGLNPDSIRVSAKPNYGCGGAMGPAQFIPSTWLGYKERVANATGHNPPNPWSIEDAFTAAAIKLAASDATAQTPEAEIRAAKIYISGRANCSSYICNYYSQLALDKASRIARDLPAQRP